MAKDRLDGTKKGNFLWELYTAPGRILLWLQYMNPKKGYSSTRMGARHARSPIMTFLYSTGFWLFVFLGAQTVMNEYDISINNGEISIESK